MSPPSSSLAAVSAQPGGSGQALPEGTRSKLWELFGQIEHEFENLYSENAARELFMCMCRGKNGEGEGGRRDRELGRDGGREREAEVLGKCLLHTAVTYSVCVLL